MCALLPAAGLAAFAAQAKYDSFILEAITLASAATLATRVVLGYQRMAQRCGAAASPWLPSTLRMCCENSRARGA